MTVAHHHGAVGAVWAAVIALSACGDPAAEHRSLVGTDVAKGDSGWTSSDAGRVPMDIIDGADAELDVPIPDADDVPVEPPECSQDSDCDVDDEPPSCGQPVCGEGGVCGLGDAPDGTPCTDGEDGLCAGGTCVFECGDGWVQTSLGEGCDDGNTDSGDGCRSDCVTEEPIGAGFTGGQCDSDAACAPAGSICIPEVGGGSCAVACETFCKDQAGSPTTFCISAGIYASRMDTELPAELYPALCVSKCDYLLFPRSGCRAGLHCEQRERHETSVVDEVCVPGPWSIGLALSADGGQVLGLEASEPDPAEPYSRLLQASCSGSFEPVPTALFKGLAGTLMAMGPDGHTQDWERLCAATGLPEVHELGVEAMAGRAFRLSGSRLDVVSWTAAGIYGSKGAKGVLVGGPLFATRAMVHRSGGKTYLYADGAADYPYADPARGRHFGWVEGGEWGPLDAEAAPHAEFVTIKSDGTHAFYRQWGRLENVLYLAQLAMDHVFHHGVPLGIGDVSFPTGGDIDGHASHEKGVDVDIYLLTFAAGADDALDLDAPKLWVAECSSAGGWSCAYHEDKTGQPEDVTDPDHVPASDMLTTLAQFAYDHPGPSHFVQHDVVVLSAFAALAGNTPKFIDASSASAQGWPPHKNHVHIRFFK